MTYKYPDFIICGAQKCGTTLLFNLLSKHSRVCVSTDKEIHYFDDDENYSKGIEWYLSNFEHCRESNITGEATPHYYTSNKAAVRINETLSDVVLIFIFRDPVLRAYSNYWFNVSRGAEYRSFKHALNTEDGMNRYIRKGFYREHLEKFIDLFGKRNIILITLRDLLEEKKNTLVKIFDKLELEYEDVDVERVNETKVSKSRIYRLCKYTHNLINKYADVSIPNKVKNKIDNCFEKTSYPTIDSGTKNKLSHLYKKDTERLHELGVDTRHWHSNMSQQ